MLYYIADGGEEGRGVLQMEQAQQPPCLRRRRSARWRPGPSGSEGRTLYYTMSNYIILYCVILHIVYYRPGSSEGRTRCFIAMKPLINSFKHDDLICWGQSI